METCNFISEDLMQPPVGESNFRNLIEYRDTEGNPYLFVDKSLLIKAILDDSSHVKLIVRPRRFGKTLNMSMLHHFFAEKVESKPTASLFENLKITMYKKYLERFQGKYPVINLTFKDVKASNFEDAYEKFKLLISKIYESNIDILIGNSLSGNPLTERQKKIVESILDRNASYSDTNASLKELSFYLYRYYGVKPIILIDEYDTPIQAAYLANYYKEMIAFIKGFLGTALKDNPYLEQAILTGVLRISKESIFSDLNNVSTYSVFHPRYSEYFGFTEKEVSELLSKSSLEDKFIEVTDWYNGYKCGHTTLYNPWSIVNYIKNEGRLNHYWVNTSDNILIKNLIIHASSQVKEQLKSILHGNPVVKSLNENIVYDQIETSDSALWTLLVMSGYLKIKSCESNEPPFTYQVDVPNSEVRDLYRKLIGEWLSGVNDASLFNNFIVELLQGNMNNFEENLQRIMMQTLSVHDIKGKDPEKFFHGFLLGLVACIDSQQYLIQSNKESGFGRFDIAIIPKDTSKLGIIFEVKNTNHAGSETLTQLATEALLQIEKLSYIAIFTQHNIHKVLKIGLAFSGKKLVVKYKNVQI